jgi:hypothetical protein
VYRLTYMGTATIRQGDAKVEVGVTMFAEAPDDWRWGGSFLGGEGELSEGDATFRFHDATEGEARILRLSTGWKKGKFRGTSELRSLY